jgi:hypothetical protein
MYTSENQQMMKQIENLSNSIAVLKQDLTKIHSLEEKLSRMDKKHEKDLIESKAELIEKLNQLELDQLEIKTKVWKLTEKRPLFS